MFEEIELADDGENILAPGHHSFAFNTFVWDDVDEEE
jgi:hypothetical protein